LTGKATKAFFHADFGLAGSAADCYDTALRLAILPIVSAAAA
jgi:hypothetical protein